MTFSRLSAVFTLLSCQTILSAEGRYFGGNEEMILLTLSVTGATSYFPGRMRLSQQHHLCLLSVTLSISPLIMFLISLCHGLIHDRILHQGYPASLRPAGEPAVQEECPGWSLQESPVTCHQLGLRLRWRCASSPALWVVGQAHQRATVSGLPFIPHNKVNPSCLDGTSCSPQHGVWCAHPNLHAIEEAKGCSSAPTAQQRTFIAHESQRDS